jgi:hypothetical protein
MFGPTIPTHSMMLLLSVVFSVIQPFVLVCGLIYFAMSLVVESYNWGWVFRRPYEGGGMFWKQVGGADFEMEGEGRRGRVDIGVQQP